MKAHSSHFHCWGEVPPDRPHGEEQAWAGRSAIKCRARQGCSSWASTKKGFVGAEMWLQVWWAEDREAASPVEGGYKTREGNWKEKKRVKPEKKKKKHRSPVGFSFFLFFHYLKRGWPCQNRQEKWCLDVMKQCRGCWSGIQPLSYKAWYTAKDKDLWLIMEEEPHCPPRSNGYTAILPWDFGCQKSYQYLSVPLST